MKQNLFYRRMVCVLLFMGSMQVTDAQDSTLVERLPWQQILEQLSETDDYENTSWEEYQDVLSEYAEHPINLNTATREDLEQFPFLSAQQIEDILAYIYQYGEMKSLGELAMVKSVDWYQRQLLGYFVYVGEQKKRSFPAISDILKYGKQEIVGDVKCPLYRREGDKDGYLGYPYKHWIRYQFHRGDYVKWGLLASQDAGEPFFAGKNHLGYDFYSYYLQVKKWGRLRNLTLGKFRLREGMGLILNNDFSFGKLSMLSSLGRMGTSIRVHSSRYAANYLQGVATTLNVAKGWDVSAFLSYRKIDATIKKDSISTILTTGLHRTQKEIESQGVASAFLVGGNVHYSLNGFHIGSTGIYYTYFLPLNPDKTQLYKRYAPSGSAFWNVSIDYGYISHRWTLQGETATGDCGVVATVNSISYLFSDKFSLSGLYRFYPYRYYALYGNSFSAGSSVQDESGMYLGMHWAPSTHWVIDAYGDVAYFAWPKYHTSESTYSKDFLGSLIYRPSKLIALNARYQFKEKYGVVTQRMRFALTLVGQALTSKTQMDATLLTHSKGYMASEMFSYRYRWLRLNAFMGYFHTTDYDSRVYAFEPGMLYAMSFGSYYGHGIRYALLAKMEINKHLLAVCKFSSTKYFDRNVISLGLQQIEGSTQSELEFQVKWKW